MARKVYIYNSISSLNEHPNYHEIIKCPHIVATSNLTSAIKEMYPNNPGVFDIHKVQDKILNTWENSSTAFQEFINIGRIIREMKISGAEELIHKSFIKNKRSVLNAIRIMVEADLYPDHLLPVNAEERLYKAIWGKLEEVDASFGKFRSTMTEYSLNAELFTSKLRSIDMCFDANTIVLVGFYFITPIQERLFDMLENCGKTLIFLCCFDTLVPQVGEIWSKVLSISNGFPQKDDWVSAPIKPMRNQAFGSIFSDNPNIIPQTNVSIIKYDTEMDMLSDMPRLINDGYALFSTDINATDKLLKEFYPQLFKRRHLLAYPVGQYIYKLHSMWNENTQHLELSINDIQACFSSGWVETNGINGLKHMDELEQLHTYFSDCRFLEDWETRLDLLTETKHSVLSSFERHLPDVPIENRRWHKLMGNPFLNFSCFGVDTNTIDELIMLIRHLINTSKELFSDHHEIDINEHLDKIRRILSAKRDEDSLLKEEQTILDELYERLKISDIGVSKCLPGEISEAIMIIIGDGIFDDESFEARSRYDESLVKPLYQVESAPLISKGKVHLCLADETRLPGRKSSYVWPIVDDMLDRMRANLSGRRLQYIEDMCFVINNSSLANRYLFFSLLQNQTVEISWVSTENGKDIAASPYVQILNSVLAVSISPYDKSYWSLDDIKEIKSATTSMKLGVDKKAQVVEEAKLDLALCSWRYTYGYLLSQQPRFISDFHYSFAISSIIRSFVGSTGVSKQEVSDEVLTLFPYLREIQKQNIKDHIGTSKNSNTDTLDNVTYPQSRLDVHFLLRMMVDKADEQLRKEMSIPVLSPIVFSTIGINAVCIYCPYVNTCPHSNHIKEKDII